LETIKFLIDFVLHIDKHLGELMMQHGPWWMYGIIFLIIFIETGVVFMPFLPGDSLLFASGIPVFCFGVFFLYVAHIGPQNSDVRLLEYIELYKVIGIGGIISGIILEIIAIFVFIKFIRKK